MNNTDRDKILIDVSASVGRIEGSLSGVNERIKHLETSKVSWKAFTSIGSIVLGLVLTASKFLFERGQ